MENMLQIIVIVLVIGVFAMGIVIAMLWRKMLGIAKPLPQQPAQQSKEPIPMPHTIPENVSKDAQTQAGVHTPPPKAKIQRIKVPQGVGIEQLVELFADYPGILGAFLGDRFGQPIAVDSNLFINKVALPALFIEIIKSARNEYLNIGKPKHMTISGEGSYWIFGEIVGMPWGLWFENDISVQDGVIHADDFRNNVALILKSNYTQIW